MAQNNGSSNKYAVIFDGRQNGTVIKIEVPDQKRAKVMTETTVGDYITFGQQIGEFGGKPFFMNMFVHKNGNLVDLKRLVGQKVVGYPVVMEKTLPDGRTFYHVDIHLTASAQIAPTHRMVASATPPGDSWWGKKARRKADPEIDLVFSLPKPADGGIIALVKYMGQQQKAA